MNPLLMTVIGNPGRQYQANPHIIIDSSDNRVLGIERGHPMHTFDKAWKKAVDLAARLGRNIHIVAHPGVPKWMKRGTQVSGIFMAMGPYTTVTPDGQWISQRNPRGRMQSNPPRSAKRQEAMLDDAIGKAWARHASGIQVMMTDIPKIFRDIKLEISAGADLETAVKSVAGRFRVNRNGRVRRNPSFGASMAGSLAGGLLANALSNPPRGAAARFIGNKIGQLVREGYPQRQAIAIAYSEARRIGYRVNPLTPSETSEMIARARIADHRARGAQRMGDPTSETYYRARRDEAEYVVGGYGSRTQANPGPGSKRKIVMTIERFANWVKAKRDPAMWRAFLAKFKGYEKWTHGARSRKVTLEWQEVPGMSGLWITYDGGKQPESTYIMPHGSPRKGAWKHPWATMPDIKHDPEAGVVLTKLRGKSRITDFYHK